MLNEISTIPSFKANSRSIFIESVILNVKRHLPAECIITDKRIKHLTHGSTIHIFYISLHKRFKMSYNCIIMSQINNSRKVAGILSVHS